MQKDVAVIIFVDSKGLVLLQQKTYDAPRFPGVWSFFGGSVEEGETPITAATREALEELEIQISATDLTFFKEFPYGGKKIHVFTTPLSDNTALVLHEGRGMGFFSHTECEHLALAEPTQVILSDYFANRP